MTESDNTEGSCDLVLVGAHAPWLGGHGAPILLPGALTVRVGILPGNSTAQVGFRRRRTAVAGLFGMVQLPVSIRCKARCHRIRMARVPDQVVRWSRPAEWLLLARCLACDPAPYGRDHFSSVGCRLSGSGRSASCSRAPSSARSPSVRLMGLRMGRGSCPRTPRRDRTLAWPCPDAPTHDPNGMVQQAEVGTSQYPRDVDTIARAHWQGQVMPARHVPNKPLIFWKIPLEASRVSVGTWCGSLSI